MYVYVGKLNWLTYARNECVTIVFPAGFALNDPVCVYWQWTIGSKGNRKRNHPQIGLITRAVKTSTGCSVTFPFEYYTFNAIVLPNVAGLSVTMSSPRGDTSAFTLETQFHNTQNILTTSVYIGKLDWLTFGENEMVTVVLPLKADGQPVILNHQWTRDSSGKEKTNHTVVSALNVDLKSSDAFRASFSDGYYFFGLEIPKGSKELVLSMTNPHGIHDAKAPYRLEQMDFRQIGIQGVDETTKVSRLMPIDEVMLHLEMHKCKDITNQIDFGLGGEYAIAFGGYSDVYRFKLSSNQAQVALKIRRLMASEDEANLTEAARELHTWSKCNHPNVIKLLGFAKFRGRIAMIHGDLKGDNVFVSIEGTPVIADLGGARLKNRSLSFTGPTGSTTMTMQWAAPELLMQVSEQTMKADIYALGMTILEAFTGEVPYPKTSQYLIPELVVTKRQPPARPSDVIPPDNKDGDRLWKLLQDCWEFEPQNRPSAIDVVEVVSIILARSLKVRV
ncbi:kinase domain protein [Ceratobasidium sp. AG-Ba]|nr:kinase domain protein [Ceratobasidium sp. AG-Ba]